MREEQDHENGQIINETFCIDRGGVSARHHNQTGPATQHQRARANAGAQQRIAGL